MPSSSSPEEQRFRDLEGQLAGRFPESAPADVSRLVDEARLRYADAKIRTYVPTLVEREVREHLRGVIQRRPSSADRDAAEQAFSAVAEPAPQI